MIVVLSIGLTVFAILGLLGVGAVWMLALSTGRQAVAQERANELAAQALAARGPAAEAPAQLIVGPGDAEDAGPCPVCGGRGWYTRGDGWCFACHLGCPAPHHDTTQLPGQEDPPELANGSGGPSALDALAEGVTP